MKTAIILFNLGGPDNQQAVRPFLFNLFSDPAIFRLPALLRIPLAWLVAKRRTPKAQGIYEQMGGGSPILPNTEKQAAALQAALGDLGDVKTFICMRYWQPRAFEVTQDVRRYNPDRIVLLPLYPQYSTTTTASSVVEWNKVARDGGLHNVPTKTLCCYPTEPGFIAVQAQLIKAEIEKAKAFGAPRVVFSAHGLPEKVVKDGDPYQWQCEQTAKVLVAELGDIEWVSSYQSRVGPLKWIGPSTEEEIERAGSTKTPLIVVPIAFVSEHSETLVELDIEYKELAEHAGVPYYGRVGTVMAEAEFINGLAAQVRQLLHDGRALCSQHGGRLCPQHFTGCPHK